MKNNERLLYIIGILCGAGCLFLSVFNAIQASFADADVIEYTDYRQGVSVSDVIVTTGSDGNSKAQNTININTATAEELADFLPGIGPAKAAKIVQYREASGGFDSVDELINVNGIGEKTLANIRPYCRVKD